MTKIGELLQQARIRRGLSLQRAADMLGCTRLTYTQWERGHWMPDGDRAVQLAAFTGESKAVVLEALGVLTEREAVAVLGTMSDEEMDAYVCSGAGTRTQNLLINSQQSRAS